MRTVGALLFGFLLGVNVLGVQEPKPKRDSVQNVLENVRHRAEEQTRDDQRRALLLIGQARESAKAGRLDEAVRGAFKARQLFPESAEIRQALRNLQARQRASREQALNQQQAAETLNDALLHIDTLVEERRYYHALQLAEAVNELAARVPASPEAAAVKAKSRKFLEEFHTWVASDPPELRLEKADESAADRPRTAAELKRALSRALSVDWHGERLQDALTAIGHETGVAILVDPTLERLRVPAQRRLHLRVQNTPAERLLKLVAELTETTFLLAEGHALLTTKEKALLYTLARGRDAAEADRLLRQMLPASQRAGRSTAKAVGEPRQAVKTPTPAYLESAEDFIQHIEQLLRPITEDDVQPD